MIRCAGKNAASNLKRAVPSHNSSVSAYSQAMRRFSTRRGLSTNNEAPKQPTAGSGKPDNAKIPGKKSSFPVFTVTATAAVASLAVLALEVDEENELAERIVDEIPYLDHTLRPFLYVVGQLREYHLLAPKPVAPRARSPSPSPPPSVPEQLDVDNFNDVQSHVHIAPVQEEEVQAEQEKEVEAAVEATPAEDDLFADIEPSGVVQIVQEAQQQQQRSAAAQEEEDVREEPVEVVNEVVPAEEVVVETKPLPEPATHAESSAVVHASALPRVVAEDTMHSVHGGGSVGEVLSTVAKNSIALRHELEAVLLKDIHNLDAPALRIRITQLAAELFERLSWESIRLSHSVRQVENELTEKYETLMAKQRKELEFEVNKLLFERECELNAKADVKVEEITKKFQEELNATIKAQAEGFQATLQQQLEEQAHKIHTELQGQLNHQVALVRKSHSDALLALQPKIESLQADLQKYEAVFENTKDAVQHTLRSHAVSSAVLALELMLSESNYGAKDKVADKLTKLKQLCKEDELVVNLLDTLPVRVQKEGALSLSELQVRFQVMREEVRKAALAPEAAPKLVGQLVGTVLAGISIAPKGYVSGQGTEEILARAAYYLELGKVKESLKELEAVSGYSKVLMKDWQEYAQERLVVDQALRTLKADSVIRHRSFNA